VVLSPGRPVSVQVGGVGGVPAGDVGAVSVRLVANQATLPGDVRVSTYGASSSGPALRTQPGHPVFTTAVVPTGGGGRITLLAQRSTTVDVTTLGYWTRAGAVGQRLVPLTPARLRTGAVSAQVALVVQTAGRSGVPVGATGVWVSLTARSAQQTSLSVPTVSGGPAVSQLVVPAGRTRTTLLYVPLSPDGTFRVTSNRDASVSVDVRAYAVQDDGASPGGRYQPLPQPAQVFSAGAGGAHSALVAGVRQAVAPLGVGGLPVQGVGALLLRVTVSTPTAAGWLAVVGDVSRSRVLTFDGGAGGTALVVVRPDAHQRINLTAFGGSTALQVEALGWWSA
jgi:hypothetical protein